MEVIGKRLMEQRQGEQFIRTALLNNISGLIDKGFDYVAFVIIGQGIETLGSFFDNKPFDHYEFGLPRQRFDKGISLMHSKYHPLSEFLWKNLRCGLAHQLKPKKEITLTSYQSRANDLVHLYKGDKTQLTYFVVDTLFKDFKDACEKVIARLNDPNDTSIEQGKRTEVMLTIRNTQLEIDPDTGTITEIIT